MAILEARNNGYFHGVNLPANGPSLSHFLFVDAVIFLGKWTTSNAMNLTRMLRCFHIASGLNVNFAKNKVCGIGVRDDDVHNLSLFLKCDCIKLPFSYLGLTVGANMNLAKN